jgi:hypothetical protein
MKQCELHTIYSAYLPTVEAYSVVLWVRCVQAWLGLNNQKDYLIPLYTGV